MITAMSQFLNAIPPVSTPKRREPATLSIAKELGGVLLTAITAYAVGHAYLPADWPAKDFLKDHITTPVSGILICTVLALYAPPYFVNHLRNAKPYRFAVRSIKIVHLAALVRSKLLCAGRPFRHTSRYFTRSLRSLSRCHQTTTRILGKLRGPIDHHERKRT